MRRWLRWWRSSNRSFLDVMEMVGQLVESRRPEGPVVLEPGVGLAEWLSPEARRSLLGGLRAGHETGALEDLEMLRNRLDAHRERRGQLADRRFAEGEAGKDRAPRRIGKGGEGVAERVDRHLSSSHWLYNRLVVYCHRRTSRVNPSRRAADALRWRRAGSSARPASRGRLALPDLEQERLSRPVQHRRQWKGRRRDACRSPAAVIGCARRAVARRSGSKETITVPMPHRTFAALAKRRLVGKEGRERIREVRNLLAELPDYKNGPYADLRKSLLAEIEDARVRSSAVHRDSIAVRREGAAQVALVGPPNVGKSSILQALSEIQIKTGDYAFTTLRPVPALTRIGGVLVQLVEIPGLIEGAADDRGGGRALLGVLRSVDAIVFCARGDADPSLLGIVRGEVVAAGIDKPAAIAMTRADEADPDAATRLRAIAPDLPIVAVSVLDERSLDELRETIWALTGLIRVRLRSNGVTEDEPLALHPPATVDVVADAVHHDLAASSSGARVWGPSAKFDGQRVGRDHEVLDGDVVEILR